MARVTPEEVDALLQRAEQVIDSRMGLKTTVVLVRLQSGFELVASSSCVRAEDYDHALGVQMCLRRIRDQVFQLEGYVRQLADAAERASVTPPELGGTS